MKISGILLVILGIILGIMAATMDVSVEGSYKTERIINLGLMNDRSNLSIGAGVTFISGILLIGFSSFGSAKSKDGKKCPHCVEMIKREATICRYCNKEQSVESCVSAETVDEITRIKLLITKFISHANKHRRLLKILFIIVVPVLSQLIYYLNPDTKSFVKYVFGFFFIIAIGAFSSLLCELFDSLIRKGYKLPVGLKGYATTRALFIITPSVVIAIFLYLIGHGIDAIGIVAYIVMFSLYALLFDLFRYISSYLFTRFIKTQPTGTH